MSIDTVPNTSNPATRSSSSTKSSAQTKKPAKDNENEDNNDFVLKHRLIGAGILISVGVLFLPWILGSYSVDKVKGLVAGDAESSTVSISQNDFESLGEKDIKVFVSKIKPVSSSSKKTDKTASEKKEVSDSVTEKKQSTEQKVVAKKAKETKKAPDKVKVSKKTSAKKDKVTASTDKKNTTKKDKEVSQGYIVSVGVFVNSKNVGPMMKDLRSKSFKPSSSKIQTSKGPGTRVWLGPFATRAEAGKERTKLKQSIGGKPGILKYP
ncbi:MAG: SPOR domain-containing protein [Arenicella sp.]